MKLLIEILAFQLANAEFKHKKWQTKSMQKKAKSPMKAYVRSQELTVHAGIQQRTRTRPEEDSETSRNIICGGEINDDAIITSPGFDRGYYDMNLKCTWDIDIPGASSITINPEFFEVESSIADYDGENIHGPCDYDWLSVNWEDDNQKDYFYKFCSFNTTDLDQGSKSTDNLEVFVGDFSAPLVIQGDNARIRFMTDEIVAMRGFKLRIEATKSCDVVQTGSGAISSPGWPENYDNNEECKFTLAAEPGKIIKINFNEFDVAKSHDCHIDSLTIMGRRHCGQISDKNSPGESVVIPTGSTVITWKADGSVRKRGFSFTWESVASEIEVSSGAQESAAGFHDHMQIFLEQLVYQMDLKRPKRLKALNRLWGNVRIAEEYFQKAPEGTSINDPKYKIFDFNTFDSSASICTNLNIFAENARQFFDNYVNLDDHETPKITLKKWHKMADKISRISEKIKTHKSLICHKWNKKNGEYEFF